MFLLNCVAAPRIGLILLGTIRKFPSIASGMHEVVNLNVSGKDKGESCHSPCAILQLTSLVASS